MTVIKIIEGCDEEKIMSEMYLFVGGAFDGRRIALKDPLNYIKLTPKQKLQAIGSNPDSQSNMRTFNVEVYKKIPLHENGEIIYFYMLDGLENPLKKLIDGYRLEDLGDD